MNLLKGILKCHSLTNAAAAPIPVPIHILTIPIWPSFSSLNSVATCLAPVQPNGWPKAIAPPRGLIFEVSLMPNLSMQYIS